MNAIIEKTRNVLVTLSDIQPAVSTVGLREASQQIVEMKADLICVLEELAKEEAVVMERVVNSLHADMLSQALRLGSVLLECEPDKMDDEQVQILGITAQCFAAKSHEYLECKANLGGSYGN